MLAVLLPGRLSSVNLSDIQACLLVRGLGRRGSHLGHTTNLVQYAKVPIVKQLNEDADASQRQWLSKVDPLVLESLIALLGRIVGPLSAAV